MVLLGPSHRVAFDGIALSGARAFETPLGLVPTDEAGARELLALDWVDVLDEAHALEHSLEVHLPFLQTVLPEATVLPLVVGSASPRQVATILQTVGRDPGTLIVVSTDLSHYHDYETARRIDAETTRLIEELSDGIRPDQACGCQPLNGLLHLARDSGYRVRTLDLRNSGDTAGPRDRVVGYGAYAVH